MKTKDILNMNRKVKGGILVEFALAVPVLAIILYYASDVPRYSRYKSQMKNSAYMAASMIQNISQDRNNKTISKKDLKIIGISSFLNHFNGLQQFIPFQTYYGLTFLLYVKGLPDGKASVIWMWDSNTPTQPPTTSSSTSHTTVNTYSSSTLNVKKNVDPHEIHKDLIIKEGEVKIILQQTINYGFSDKKIGFYLLTPTGSGYSQKCYFHTTIIFSPRPGLFSETPPS